MDKGMKLRMGLLSVFLLAGALMGAVAQQVNINTYREQILRNVRLNPNMVQERPYKNYRCDIEPFIKTKWGQRAPYNNYCPTLNGNRCITGCGATAMAQLMYYYKWPLDDTKGIPAYCTARNKIQVGALPPTRFVWGKMTPSPVVGSEEADAVAQLLLYCGASLQMDYGTDYSTSNTNAVANALKTYFKYSNSVRVLKRKDYSWDEWEEIIYNELAQGHAVLYRGANANEEGHIFLIDGYDKRGYFHFNWGWGGDDDGFFKLSLEGTEHDRPSVSYTSEHFAIVGAHRTLGTFGQIITKDRNLTIDKLGYSSNLLAPLRGKEVFQPLRVTCYLSNTVGRDCKPDIAIGVYRGGKLVDTYPLYGQQVKKGTKVAKRFVINRLYTDMAEGDYVLRVVCKDMKRYIWIPVLEADNHALKLHVEGGRVSVGKW